MEDRISEKLRTAAGALGRADERKKRKPKAAATATGLGASEAIARERAAEVRYAEQFRKSLTDKDEAPRVELNEPNPPEIPEAPEVVEEPIAEVAPEAPIVAETPEAPIAAETPEAPIAAETPEAPIVAETPEAPVAAEAPDAPRVELNELNSPEIIENPPPPKPVPEAQPPEDDGVIRIEGMVIEPTENDGILRVEGMFFPAFDTPPYAPQPVPPSPASPPTDERDEQAAPPPTAELRYPTYANYGDGELDYVDYLPVAEPYSDVEPDPVIDYNARDAEIALDYLTDEPLLHETDGAEHKIDDAVGEEEEMLRFLRDYDSRIRDPYAPTLRRPDAYDDGEIELCLEADNVEENEKLVALRLDYEINELKARKQIASYTFSTDSYGRDISLKRLVKEISERISKRHKALALEREESGKYYAVAQDKLMGDPHKRAKNRQKIDSIVGRIDQLLAERSEINQQLIALYLSSNNPKKRGVNTDKNKKGAMKTARSVFRAQRPLAKKVMRMHAPVKLKNKIFELMNSKTLAYADIDYIQRLLGQKSCTGTMKRDLKRMIRDKKRSIRYYDSDIAYFVRRAERHHKKHVANCKQAAWWIGTLIVGLAVAAAVLYLGFFKYGWF